LIKAFTSSLLLHAREHVKKYIEQKFWKSDAIQEEIEKIIINLDSDSDSDSDEMSDQTDNETEDYPEFGTV
jgi:KaiC/GvpD/RAD55 family RecA-like ATPase